MSDNNTIIDKYSDDYPYVVKNGLSGEVVIFNEDFAGKLNFAFMDDCLESFTQDEQEFIKKYLEYGDGVYSDKYVIAFDKYLANVVNGVENISIENCLI